MKYDKDMTKIKRGTFLRHSVDKSRATSPTGLLLYESRRHNDASATIVRPM